MLILEVAIMSALLPLLLLLSLPSCASLPAIEAAADAPFGPRVGATRLRRAPDAAGHARRLGLGGRARRHGSSEEGARRRKQQRKKRDRAIAKAAAQAAARQEAVAARVGQADLDGTAAAEDTARIVDGREVEPKERYPYMASFWPGKACGGALIHPRVVLTAAHCVFATPPTPTVEAPGWTEGVYCVDGALEGSFELYFESGTASYTSRATAQEACRTGCLANDVCIYADLYFESVGTSTTYSCYLHIAECSTFTNAPDNSMAVWIRPVVDVGRWNINPAAEVVDAFDTNNIADSVTHPDWNATAFDDPDFALVLLATPSAMAPVTLAREEADAPLGADAIVMGWGITVADSTNTNPRPTPSATLKEASITIAANDTCGLIPVVDGDETGFEIGVVKGPHVLCGAKGDGVSCAGDSGGPLIVAGEDAAGDVLVGIVSYGPPVCGDFNAAYARVSWAFDWIEATMLTKWGLALDPSTNSSEAPSTSVQPSTSPSASGPSSTPSIASVSPTKNPTKQGGRFEPLAKSSKSHGSSKSAKIAPSKGFKSAKAGSKHGSKSSKSSKG